MVVVVVVVLTRLIVGVVPGGVSMHELLLWLLFPVIKALHEFGHASAAKAGGGEVHDLGIMFLVLMPVPYVEASSANVFPSKFKSIGSRKRLE